MAAATAIVTAAVTLIVTAAVKVISTDVAMKSQGALKVVRLGLGFILLRIPSRVI